MPTYLTTEALIKIAGRILGTPPSVRDYGLLDSAAYRPQSIVFGSEAYPTLHLKAAVLMESIVRNHPLLDGNKRLGWAATVVFYGLNGYDVEPPSTDAAVEFVVSVVVNHTDVAAIAKQLETWAQSRGESAGS